MAKYFKRGGQAAMEYLVLTGFTLLILTVLLISAYSKMTSSEVAIDVGSLEAATLKIKQAADFVYIHGHPTKITVSVYIPGIVDGAHSFMENKTINLAAGTRAGHTDVWASTRGDVAWDLSGNSSMPSMEGYYVLTVESTAYESPYAGTINIHL